MSAFDDLHPSRQATTAAATAGCWDGTKDLVAAVVKDSLRNPAWRPARAAVVNVLASNEGPFMEAEEFFRWRLIARGVARYLKLEEHPRDALGFSYERYQTLGNVKRAAERRALVTKIEAMACAHYALGLPAPCGPEGIREWFWPRFAQLESAARALNVTPGYMAGQINGYEIVDGVRKEVVADKALIRALDWAWRFGPISPYGKRDVTYYPPERPVFVPKGTLARAQRRNKKEG